MSDMVTLTLHVPSLQELAGVLLKGLKKTFTDVMVSVVECPDLTEKPFTFPVKGICGSPRIADVGGDRNMIPIVRKDKVFDINTVAKQIKLPGAYMLGAGAVSYQTLGLTAELTHSVKAETEHEPAINGSYLARVNPSDGTYVLEKYSEKYSDCNFGLMAHLYASEGKTGKVIEVKANTRTGEDNFVSCMRKALAEQYGDKIVGIGGTFVIQQGKANIHVMPPEFPPCPFESQEDITRWLKFYEMTAPLICQSVFVSHDPGHDLRMEHTHCFSHHGDGGHYHYDTTPETVRYLGYFHPAELLFRIDGPEPFH
ncbi:ester hydrolase C11orf54 homolog isoform X1 [Pleurodeles waltl]|uniref:ester hydrolase C11orf54 homolog isoform X1 n=2 Tax=Pleurodeles waltl TaxID=8319 RepID=UPI003709C05E